MRFIIIESMQCFNIVFRVYLSTYLFTNRVHHYLVLVSSSCHFAKHTRSIYVEVSWRIATCYMSVRRVASRRLQFTRQNGLAARNARHSNSAGRDGEHPSVLHLVIAATLLWSSVNRNGVGRATYRSWPQRQKL